MNAKMAPKVDMSKFYMAVKKGQNREFTLIRLDVLYSSHLYSGQ